MSESPVPFRNYAARAEDLASLARVCSLAAADADLRCTLAELGAQLETLAEDLETAAERAGQFTRCQYGEPAAGRRV